MIAAVERPEWAVIPVGVDFQVVQREHREEYDALVHRVQALMNYLPSDATKWMTTRNPLLGGVSPVAMIAHGRAHRLDKFITAAEDALKP